MKAGLHSSFHIRRSSSALLAIMALWLACRCEPAQAGFTDQTTVGLTAVTEGSSAWGDYDNDGDLDILLTGSTGSGYISKVYRNNGNGTFTDISAGLTGVYRSAVAWGDYDNDGFLDILLTGESATGNVSKIYRNNGNGTFTDSGIALTTVNYSAVAWGDYDKDGFLDILLTGYTGSVNVSKIYRNNRDGTFSDSSISLTAVRLGAVAWGDYDKDGFPDILLTGFVGGSTTVSKIYHNNSNGTFTDSGIPLTEVRNSDAAWGDYDNDGDLDILLAGQDASGTRIFKVYRNNGNGTFTNVAEFNGMSNGSVAWGDYDNDGDLDILMTGKDITGTISYWLYRNDGNGTFTSISAGLQAVWESSVSWGDYDNDGDLDILLTGATRTVSVSKLYRNDETVANVKPQAPAGLAASVVGSDATLTWNKSTDDHTPQNGLNYNLRLSTTSGGGNLVSPMANATTGFRRVARFGNTGQTNAWTARNLPRALYYWSAQTIDTAFQGSSFATQGSFIIDSPPTDIALSAASVAENQPVVTTVGTLTATDADAGDTSSYSLVSGTGDTDNGSFTIAGSTLKTAASFNYETKRSYSIRVRVTDQLGLTFEKQFPITVTDVNEAPTNLAASNSSVAENQAANTTVGTLSATDPDTGNTHTFALASGTGDTDNGSFTIVGTTLQTTASFNYESKSSYSIRVRATDQGSLTFAKQLTITVTDVNEAPTNLAASNSSVAENQASGTTVGTLSATDPDSGNTFTFTLASGTGDTDNASLTIVGAALKTAASFNYESKSSYSIRVRATDQGGLTFDKQLTITVTDVNDAPTDLALSNSTVAENQAANTTVGTLSATDPCGSKSIMRPAFGKTG